MTREVDVRDPSATVLTPQREAELRQRASRLSGSGGTAVVDIRAFDQATGNPARITLRSATPSQGDFVRRSLAQLQHLAPALGLAPTQAPEFVADPEPQETSSGGAAVHLRQQYKGISIFQAGATVRFAPDGAFTEILANAVTVADDLPVSPTLAPDQAVLRAAQHVAEVAEEAEGIDPFGEPIPPAHVDVSGLAPSVRSAIPGQPNRPTVFDPGPFAEPVKASLVWFSIPPDLRLAWEVDLVMPDHQRAFHVLVDTQTGDILYAQGRG